MNNESHLCTTIQSSSDNVVVFVKPAGITSSQPPLRQKGDTEEGEDRRVDAHAKPANVVAAANASVLLPIQPSSTYQMTGVYK